MQRRQKQIHPSELRLRAIGAVVRELRERAGHSQERLSADCGFDRTYISRVERGIINPTVSRLWRIADVLEVSLTELAGQMERWVKDRERQLRRADSKRG
jgi:transcriptional regulator with XRE-family HTH domain